jgi:hypothetical protein
VHSTSFSRVASSTSFERNGSRKWIFENSAGRHSVWRCWP